jgi:hypothetical protein
VGATGPSWKKRSAGSGDTITEKKVKKKKKSEKVTGNSKLNSREGN